MLEELNAACEQVKGDVEEEEKRRGDVLDGDEQNDWRTRKAAVTRSSNNSNSDVELVVTAGVGGEHGQRAVVSARIVRLLKAQHEEVEEEEHEPRDMDELVLSDQAWKRMQPDRAQEGDEQRLQQKRSKRISIDKMDKMIFGWKETSKCLKRCNAEHLRAVLVCVVYLADVLVGERNVETFSMVVQGAGGTGKTASTM